MKIYLGADHRGFALKNKIKIWLEKNDFLHEDLGALVEDNFDDYTEYASKVASIVAVDAKARGVLFCGSGVGVDIVANKFDNVRSAVGINPLQVEAARKDDNVNILVIAADYTSERETIKMLEKFLQTKFESSTTHNRRLGDIKKLEQNN